MGIILTTIHATSFDIIQNTQFLTHLNDILSIFRSLKTFVQTGVANIKIDVLTRASSNFLATNFFAFLRAHYPLRNIKTSALILCCARYTSYDTSHSMIILPSHRPKEHLPDF